MVINGAIALLSAITFFILLIKGFADNLNTFIYTSYYLMLLLFFVWALVLTKYLASVKFNFLDFIKKNWIAIFSTLLITGMVFLSVERNFKTLNDETNLLSVSQSMLNNKNVFNTNMGKHFYEELHIIQVLVPKRPLVFSFLTYIAHTLFGYSMWNPFVVNFIIMFLFLCGMFIVVHRYSDIPTAFASLFLVIAYPVFTIYGVSGGFDLLASVLLVVCIANMYMFFREPSAGLFALLWVNLIVLSNCRYESFIFFIIMITASLRYVKLSFIKEYAFLYIVTPLVFLPLFWQLKLSEGKHQNLEAGLPLFSLQQFIKHSGIMINNFFNQTFNNPYAGVINIMGLFILIFFIYKLVTKELKISDSKFYFSLVFGVSIVVYMVIYLSHYFGEYTHPTQARFFIALSILFAVMPILLKVEYPNLIQSGKLLIVAIFIFLAYHPIAVKHQYINQLEINRITRYSYEFLNSLPSKDHLLFIDEWPGRFTALNVGGVNFAWANNDANRKGLFGDIARHLISKIYVIQKISYQTNLPIETSQLHPEFKLKTLKELQVDGNSFLRFSEVVF